MITAVRTTLDLARATDREALGPTAEGLSGASFSYFSSGGIASAYRFEDTSDIPNPR